MSNILGYPFSFLLPAPTIEEKGEKTLKSLPNELVIKICENFDDALTLHAVSATSRWLYYIANPILYSLAAEKYPHLLFCACEAGEVGIVKKLLAVGLNPNLPTMGRWSERSDCCPDGSGDAMTSTLNVLTVYDHIIGGDKHQVSGDMSRLEASEFDPTIHSNINVYLSQFKGCYWFPLHCAAMAGSIELVKLLVDSGAYIDPPSRGLCGCNRTAHRPETTVYWTPLHTALCSGNEATANLLLELGASPNVEYRRPDFRPSTALHWAALGGYLSTIQLLLGRGHGNCRIAVDVRDHEGSTPLMWSLGTTKSLQTMKCLLAHGADVEAKSIHDGFIARRKGTAVLQACARGWYRDADFLVKTGAAIEGNRYASALDRCLAALGGSPSTTQEFYSNESNQMGTVHPKLGRLPPRPGPIDFSEEANFEEMVELIKNLIRYDDSIYRYWRTQRSPLVRASAARLFSVADILLSSGSQANQEDRDGRFPLLAAIVGWNPITGSDQDFVEPAPESYLKPYSKVYETVDCLLKRGAKPNQKNGFSQTALMALCCPSVNVPGKLEIMKLMISYGADINLRSRGLLKGPHCYCLPQTRLKLSPVQMTFYENEIDICRYFVKQGAEPPREIGELRLMLRHLVGTVGEFPEPESLIADGNGSAEIHDLNIETMNCKAKFCVGLRLLLEIDRDGRLAKDPESLWLSLLVHHFPLTQRFLASGAFDASWSGERSETCKETSHSFALPDAWSIKLTVSF